LKTCSESKRANSGLVGLLRSFTQSQSRKKKEMLPLSEIRVFDPSKEKSIKCKGVFQNLINKRIRFKNQPIDRLIVVSH